MSTSNFSPLTNRLAPVLTLALLGVLPVATTLAATPPAAGAAAAAAAPRCDVPNPPPVCDPPEPLPSGTPKGTLWAPTRLPNALRVTGTATDPDATGPVTVRLTVNGTLRATVQTGATGSFAASLPIVPGSNSVCAVAVNRNRGEDATIGCRQITVGVNPFGSVDTLNPGSADVRVQGWAIDPDTTSPITVHVYVDGVGRAFPANVTRSDVGRAYPLYGSNHGFDVTVPLGSRRRHEVCVYAINTGFGTGNANTQLACTTFPLPNPNAVTVEGRFTYIDDGNAGPFQRPVTDADVEIWRLTPGLFGTWGKLATVKTNSDGWASYETPLAAPGTTYATRVLATNTAARVLANAPDPFPFWTEPGDQGAPVHLKANRNGEVLDFSYDFTDRSRAGFFNIAETIQQAHGLAQQLHRQSDADELNSVAVQPGMPSTFYNPVLQRVELSGDLAYADRVIMHEYGHYLEHQIGAFLPLPSTHNGCTAAFGPFDAKSSQHAWMEGFANWFAQVVPYRRPGAQLIGSSGPSGSTLTVSELESPSCPGLPPNTPGSTVEKYVAGALWDLVDDAGDALSANEPWDTERDLHTLIFKVMDDDLDGDRIGLNMPTIQRFRAAWIARVGDANGIDKILVNNRITP